MRFITPAPVAAAAMATVAISAFTATALFASPAANAQTAPTAPAARTAAPAADKAQHWTAGGGTVGVRWNRELAADLGLALGAAVAGKGTLSWHEHEQFDLQPLGSLQFDVRNGNLQRFVGGALQARGGYAIATRAGRIDLADFRLVPRTPRSADEAPILDLVSADGQAWFYVDRLMYELVDDRQTLAVRTMDLRITPELAARIGHPEAAGWTIADMELNTAVLRQGADTELRVDRKWHGTAVPGQAGATYLADLFMTSFNMQYSRCDGCTGVGGNGRVVFTPSSTLRNNVNNGTAQPVVAGDPLGTSTALWTADIPWYQKFSGNFAPYGNDQHPYLIWNLYRLNADGSIDQIGRSGVKHGFLTLNTGCLENPGDSHILGRGCSDVYSVSNNDSNNALGPRSEIVPHTNQWGRCGSIYDTNCDGLSNTSGNTSFSQRMLVRESQFSGPAHAGATYLFESWYLARQDINILNSMGTVAAGFTRNTSSWSVTGNNTYKLGPAIDRWVNPAAPGTNARNVFVATAEGHAKLAVKATALGGGRWRYDYAVMNLDFARAQTSGSEPNLRVVNNHGFNSFTVPTGSLTVTDLVFSDGDLDGSNDWTASVSRSGIVWTAPSAAASLNWGTMFRFSFVVDQGPVSTAVLLGITNAGSPKLLKTGGVIAPGRR